MGSRKKESWRKKDGMMQKEREEKPIRKRWDERIKGRKKEAYQEKEEKQKEKQNWKRWKKQRKKHDEEKKRRKGSEWDHIEKGKKGYL